MLGGAQAGCNHQVGAGVFGIQVDYDWSNASGSNVLLAALAPPLLTDQSRLQSLGSVTGQIGYAWDRFLGYVKLGGAFQRSTYSLLVAGLTGATASETRFGWTAGIGGEYAFLDWLTVFVEYDYYDFGTNTNTFVCPTCDLFAVTRSIDITTTSASSKSVSTSNSAVKSLVAATIANSCSAAKSVLFDHPVGANLSPRSDQHHKAIPAHNTNTVPTRPL